MHIPVLLEETVTMLAPERGGVFVDGTLGFGGHASAMLKAAHDAKAPIKFIGIDQDDDALNHAKERLGDSVQYAKGNFRDIETVLRALGTAEADGILLDIGVSSFQFDTPERGFSFQHDGPLDMRMDHDNTVSAATIVNTWNERNLAQLFWNYGEERFSRQIAEAIVRTRKREALETTQQLAELVRSVYPPGLRHRRIHPATKTFQALRIEVNQELDALKEGIEGSQKCLALGGVLAIITFHSLEDRIVKYAFRNLVAGGKFELVTKKPLVASRGEQMANPRSRSAKLRGIRRILP